MGTDRGIFKLIGKAVLLSATSFSIGSVTMSSTFSVENFSNTQEILQRAADSLVQYTWIALLWCAGCSSLLYASYGLQGLVISIVCNFAIIGWIWHSYVRAFRNAAEKHKLKMPSLALFA